MLDFLNYSGLARLVSNLKNYFAPKSHTSTTTEYGAASTTHYGHVKIHTVTLE